MNAYRIEKQISYLSLGSQGMASPCERVGMFVASHGLPQRLPGSSFGGIRGRGSGRIQDSGLELGFKDQGLG